MDELTKSSNAKQITDNDRAISITVYCKGWWVGAKEEASNGMRLHKSHPDLPQLGHFRESDKKAPMGKRTHICPKDN